MGYLVLAIAATMSTSIAFILGRWERDANREEIGLRLKREERRIIQAQEWLRELNRRGDNLYKQLHSLEDAIKTKKAEIYVEVLNEINGGRW